MAITSSRVILACTIPTIIVILSYIWFKKKEKQLTSKSANSCSLSRSPVSIRQEIDEAEKQKPTAFDAIPVEQDISSASLSLKQEPAFETLFVEQSVETFETLSVEHFEEPEATYETLTVEELEPEATILLEPEPQAKGGGEGGELGLVPEVGDHTPSIEQKDNFEQKMVSDTVSKNREKNKKSCPIVVTGASEETRAPVVEESRKMQTNGESVETPGSPVIQNDNKISELAKRIDETHIVTTITATSSPQLLDDAVTSDENDSLSSQSNDTVVDGSLDSTLVDAQTIITSSEEAINILEDSSSHDRQTSNGHCDQATEHNDNEELVNNNASSVVVASEHPAAVSSPGSIDSADHVHKITTNGTDTSAYGSASHSPAEELLESPTVSNYSDMHSEGSSDSGKGCSNIHRIDGPSSTQCFPLTPMSVFEFELPQELCGRLIGAKGRFVNYIKSKSRANISIKRHPFNADLKLCAVIGTEEDINAALVVIRKRFPLTRFPCISMVQVNAPLLSNVPIPDTLQLHLPEGVTCDVILSSLISAGHFFIQQPTHPTYPSLGRLDQCMLHCYMNGMGAPELPKPVEAGVICVASTMGGWYRAQIVYVQADADECEVRFVDYGGYSQEAISSLRQIRSDFMTLPFQASECYLANVVPLDETQGWTIDATSLFEDMAQGQILQAQIVSYSEDGIPYIHLYRIQGVMTTFINRELVDCGVAKWVEHQA